MTGSAPYWNLHPIPEALSTQQAADLLGVSCPFLIEQLDQKAVPFTEAVTRRCIHLGDLQAYQRRMDVDRKAVLDELAGEAQRLDLGY